jgi:hypothetical protein
MFKENTMKKLLIISMLSLGLVAPAFAQHYGHWRHHGHPTVIYRDNNWVAPLILGGIAGAVIANQTQPSVVVQQPPMVIQQPVYVQRQPVCTEWKEIQQPDGQIYRERTCTQ